MGHCRERHGGRRGVPHAHTSRTHHHREWGLSPPTTLQTCKRSPPWAARADGAILPSLTLQLRFPAPWGRQGPVRERRRERSAMPLDPQAQSVIDLVAGLGLPAAHTVTPQEARINAKARPRAAGPEVAKVEDRDIPGPGPDVPVRIYAPAGPGPFPILVWYHGGGWAVGDLDSADGTARHLTVGAECVTVSVDYRLAPAAEFPGPAEDCYSAAVWAAAKASRISGDASRIAVGGDSAGGNLAAAVALMARDRGTPGLTFGQPALWPDAVEMLAFCITGLEQLITIYNETPPPSTGTRAGRTRRAGGRLPGGSIRRQRRMKLAARPSSSRSTLSEKQRWPRSDSSENTRRPTTSSIRCGKSRAS